MFKDGFITSFLATYHVLKGHGQPQVTRSVKVTVAEDTILVNKILSRIKMERVKDNLSQEVESLKSAQARMVEEKEREGEELRENIEESNAETRARLEEIMRRTGNNIKRMEWESNKRQIRMKDKIMSLLGTKKAFLMKKGNKKICIKINLGTLPGSLGLGAGIQTQESTA